MTRMVYSKGVIWSHLVWLALLGVMGFVPPNIWFEAKSLVIYDSSSSVSPKANLIRDINRDMTATWQVTIHEVTRGSPTTYCLTKEHTQKYLATAVLPADLDLKWLTYGECKDLRPGKYIATISYVIETPWFMPNKATQVTSNIFTITD